jgi:hypothetical protein
VKETTLRDAQEDLYQRALADEYLANVAIIKRDEGEIETEVIDALGVLNKRGGKIGACVLVYQPIAEPAPAEVVGGVLNIDFTFLVLENPVLNRESGGTGLAALTIARRLIGIFHLYHPRKVVGCLTMQQGAIVPIQLPVAPVAYEVRFSAQEDLYTPNVRVTTPTITPSSGAAPQSVTLACATVGASIYYTLDGTHPYAGNPSAVLYTGTPVNVATAATLRAGAFKTGLIASDVNAANFS